ncbi:MAG: hypothetical protein ACMUIM_11270 [bacterium]
MTLSEWKDLLDYVLKNFKIRYDDFATEAYLPYRKRRIVGFVRYDRKEILFDQGICGETEKVTWAHEALSIYYYSILKIIRHDDEIEKEARALCKNRAFNEVLSGYIQKLKGVKPAPDGQ